jgi:hypothetical protein
MVIESQRQEYRTIAWDPASRLTYTRAGAYELQGRCSAHDDGTISMLLISKVSAADLVDQSSELAVGRYVTNHQA